MTSCLAEVYGNASSIHHFGQRAKQHLEAARRQVAAALGSTPQEVVFTSGGTEADNLAVLGAVRADDRRTRKHVITSAIEHPAVLAACAQLEREGVAVSYLPVGGDCLVDPDDVRRSIRRETTLISVMHANNETGAVQPVEEIARIARECGVCFHSDGVQAFGKLPRPDADLYSVSAHKIYAPKGAGALAVRKGTRLAPILLGGKHERERRAGTENVPGAAAFARAAALLDLSAEGPRLASLRDRLERSILDRAPHSGVNGSRTRRTPNTSNIYFDGIEGEALVIALDLEGFAVSTGAACSSGAVAPSHVLTAMGLPPTRARASIRFSVGRYNTAEQVDALADAVTAAVARLRKISPAYTHA
jgi:cysteine desulfurase